jgi:hypothetical protein
MKTYQDGEIYFIRETEYPTGTLSPFVKIGLVHYKDDRDSYGRLSEHQTGNPRRLRLDDDHIVKTQAVDMVEARLHRIFATSRISGEWFELPNQADLKKALEEAQNLAALVASYRPKFEAAMKLETEKSDGTIREATAEELELVQHLIVARKQTTTCTDLEKDIKAILTKAYSEGADIAVAAKSTMRVYSPRFDADAFQAENQELFEKYQGQVETWQHKFAPIPRAKDLGPEFDSSIAEVDVILNGVRESKKYSDLVEATLLLTNLKGISGWEAKVAEAELKLLMGNAEELKGAVRWKRFFEPTTKLDEATLAAMHPDVYKKYIFTPDPTPLVNLKKTKG